MATLPEIQSAMAGMANAITQMGSAVGALVAHLQSLQQQVVLLQAQLTTSQQVGVAGTDLDGVVASLTALEAAVAQATQFLTQAAASKP